MTTKELIRTLSLQHLGARDVERIEEAMNTDDAETMLTLVDDLVGKARKPDPNPVRAKQKDRGRL